MTENPLFRLPRESFRTVQSEAILHADGTQPFVHIALTVGLATVNVSGPESLMAMRQQLLATVADVDKVLREGYGIDPNAQTQEQ